jgi:C1A family cysteine protease
MPGQTGFNIAYNFPIYDQGDLGSCTANSCCAVLNILGIYSGFNPSRLFLYQCVEMKDNNGQLVDNGADERDEWQVLASIGVCSESLCPYVTSNFTTPPTQPMYNDALNHTYNNITVNDITWGANMVLSIKGQLNKCLPVLLAFAVQNSFMNLTAQNRVYVPSGGVVGYHEVVIMGYSDTSKLFNVLNSWGSSWGDNGYFSLPYQYVNSALVQQLLAIGTTPKPTPTPSPTPTPKPTPTPNPTPQPPTPPSSTKEQLREEIKRLSDLVEKL